MWYQHTQKEIAIIWANDMDCYNTHLGKHPIGIQVYGKNYIHGLTTRPEAPKADRIVLQFGTTENIREEWRGHYLVLTPDLQSYQILENPEDAFGSWGEILKNRTIIVIS